MFGRCLADDEISILRSEAARVDWEQARAKYEPLVAHVADRQELMNLINEMIGEAERLHTGASAASPRDEGANRCKPCISAWN